jgi:RNA polymerase sigma factor FliA
MVRTEDLWTQYTTQRDASLREKMILQYAPLVKYVVGRLAINLPAVLDSEDVISYGIIGLIDAIERYDPTRGTKFETYAIPRIRGSIIDNLRALDQIPRSTKQKAREIERAFSFLESSLGRPPSDVEVAGHMGVSLERLQQMSAQSSVITMSLDTIIDTDDEGSTLSRLGTLADRNSPDPQFEAERRELNNALVDAVQHLPERERLVMSLYYVEELTLKEISKVLGISESRVCQLHSQAVLRLRGHMRAFEVTQEVAV